ncbi:hypothetical protein LIER_16297 [Lithospermum erythrorhizon]|uniref:Retrovirus-related Pol polyprotein from transposon TNT 1-94 n=1 Tax=Lithospermum erythrorhizon TaxID=34254 RepID=A0AAV3Q639_LITER
MLQRDVMEQETLQRVEAQTRQVFCDSQSAIYLSRDLTFHSRYKHIEVRYHLVRDALEGKLLYLDKVHTFENIVDMMTKVLPKNKHEACCIIAGLVFAA